MLLSMVEPAFPSSMERYRLARPVGGRRNQYQIPNWKRAGNRVCGDSHGFRDDHGALELFPRGNSAAVYFANDGVSIPFNNDSLRSDFPWMHQRLA